MSWIQVSSQLLDKPQARKIARACGITRQHAAGCLVTLWGWADVHTSDGKTKLEAGDIDEICDCAGFARALLDVGWLEQADDGSMSITDFFKYNGASEKARFAEAKRKQKARLASAPEICPSAPEICPSAPEICPKNPDQEKRREEYTNPRAGTSDAANACARASEPAPTREAGSRGNPKPRDSSARDFSDCQFSQWLDAMRQAHPVLASYARMPDDILQAAHSAAAALPDAPKYAKLLRAYMEDTRTTEDNRGQPFVRPNKISYFLANLPEWVAHAKRWAKSTGYRAPSQCKQRREARQTAQVEVAEDNRQEENQDKAKQIMKGIWDDFNSSTHNMHL